MWKINNENASAFPKYSDDKLIAPQFRNFFCFRHDGSQYLHDGSHPNDQFYTIIS